MMGTKQEMPELTDAPTWFLDPIDGTVNFVHTFLHACISVGLTVCKEPVLGIIYNPVTSELYSAIKGKGAFLNGKPICTSKVTALEKAMLVFETTLLKFYTKDRDIYDSRLNTLINNTQAIRSIGSAAMSLAYLARGAVDCVQIDDLKAWDILAGIVIVCEAGGAVLDTKGGPYNIMKPNTVAASNKPLAEELSKLIVDTDLKTRRKRLKRTCKAKDDSC
ncbi:Inositol-phosphate phosphatase [Ooceraea biroi]|nr:Inositol-phosphate phosphatase [Ooceraea biroi]